MSTDLEQFYEIFFEESSELLAEMETCLLRLDVNSPDLEDLNAIFRAAHSIKGGAGTFGFTDMTEMTHMLETLLDKLRKGELKVRSEMIDAFLRAGDVIKEQLAGHRGEGQADPAVAAAVCEELKKLSDGVQESVVVEPVAKEEPGENLGATNQIETEVIESPAEDSLKNIYSIEFSSTGMSSATVDHLLDNLKRLGVLENLTPTNTSNSFKLKLATSNCEEDVWETLAFIVDPANLKIETIVVENTEAGLSATDYSEEAGKNTESPVTANEDEFSMTDLPPAPGYGFFPGAPAAPIESDESEMNPSVGQQPNTGFSKNESSGNINKSLNKTATAAPNSETSSIRVSIEKVDQMINLVGELVITQAMLAQTVSQYDPVLFEKLHSGMSQLERNTRDLQESVMSIRMMPISFVFSRYPRVVRDLAAKLNKRVELKTVGENTELDKGLIEKIADPLTHLVRNSLDHGIEVAEKRVAAGKPAHGTITLRAFHQGGSIVIEVSDDGAGLNRGRYLRRQKNADCLCMTV